PDELGPARPRVLAGFGLVRLGLRWLQQGWLPAVQRFQPRLLLLLLLHAMLRSCSSGPRFRSTRISTARRLRQSGPELRVSRCWLRPGRRLRTHPAGFQRGGCTTLPPVTSAPGTSYVAPP